jgi:hypothetical protein
MPGSWTSPDRPGARANALVRVAFRGGKRVGVRDYRTFAAQWLACTIPCRRFADTLAGAAARLGADVDRYSFIVVDSHHLLLASLPAHSHGFWCSRGEGPHVFEVSDRPTGNARKLAPQIGSQTVDHPGAPAAAVLSLEDLGADLPVQQDQLVIDG